MKIRPAGVEFFRADGQTLDANSRFSQFCDTRLNTVVSQNLSHNNQPNFCRSNTRLAT